MKTKELEVLEVKARLSAAEAQEAVTKKQESIIKEETINLMVSDFKNSLEPLREVAFSEKIKKSKFEKDFAKGQAEYRGIFAIFNILAKGKSSNSLNAAFYDNQLDQKYKFGKDYNGVFMLAFFRSEDLIGQLRNPQKFSDAQLKQAFQRFNTFCTNFEQFEAAKTKAAKINSLIADYKAQKINAQQYVEELNKLSFNESLKERATVGLSEKAQKKVCQFIYSLK